MKHFSCVDLMEKDAIKIFIFFRGTGLFPPKGEKGVSVNKLCPQSKVIISMGFEQCFASLKKWPVLQVACIYFCCTFSPWECSRWLSEWILEMD